MVLLHLDTDGPLHLGTDGPFLTFFFLRHRWSCCIWAQMVPCIRAQMVPFEFFFFLLRHRRSCWSQAQMVLVHLDTDGPIAFVHTSSYWIRAQMVPSVIRHRWSCCIWAQMVPLHSYIEVPIDSYIQVPMGTRHNGPI